MATKEDTQKITSIICPDAFYTFHMRCRRNIKRLTIHMRGAVHHTRVLAVAALGEGQDLDAVVGMLLQVLEDGGDRGQPRGFGQGEVRPRLEAGHGRVEDLVTFNEAVAQIGLGRVPADLDCRRGQCDTMYFFRRTVRCCEYKKDHVF